MTSLPQIDPVAETDRIKLFISKTFSGANKQTAIVAVSGGVDSATALLLTTQTLEPEHVIALHLPSRSSQPIHTQHAYEVMDLAQIPAKNRLTIPISAIIQKSWRIINHYTKIPVTSDRSPANNTNLSAQDDAGILAIDARSRTPAAAAGSRARQVRMPNRQNDFVRNRLRLANLAARLRMTLLYDQAKKFDALVIGTENRSEHLLGYYTRYGDEASDLEPIRHLYKTQVVKLAQHLGVPQSIINKPPSADLWPGQTDAQELGFTYAEADPILYLHEQGKSKDTIAVEGFNIKLIEKVINQVNRTAFKHLVPYMLK